MDGPLLTPSAEDLALAAQGGSVRAFEELVARFEGPLYNFLWMRTRNTAAAEDLAQDTFLRAWQRLSRYDSRWRFSTWLYTLAARLAVSAHRARGKESRTGSAVPLDEVPAGLDPAQVAEGRDDGRALWELAERVLRPEERSALWLRYAEDLSAEEIAAVLGRPSVTVRVLLFRARERLGAALSPASRRTARRGEDGEPSGPPCAPVESGHPPIPPSDPCLARDGIGGLS